MSNFKEFNYPGQLEDAIKDYDSLEGDFKNLLKIKEVQRHLRKTSFEIPECSPLFFAMAYQKIEAFKALLKAGANPNSIHKEGSYTFPIFFRLLILGKHGQKLV